MSGTKSGAKRAAETNRQKYGESFYADIGRVGGSHGHTGGFYADRDKARTAGTIGGIHSKRGFRLIKKDRKYLIYQKLATGSIVKFKR